MKVGEYELVNDEKLDRAINGNLTQGGKLIGGVGLEATDKQILAEYDKLGGLIKKNGLKVKQGCFWDVEEKKAFKDPEVSFEISMDQSLVDVTEDEAMAIDKVNKKKEELKSKAKSKSKKKVLRRRKNVVEQVEVEVDEDVESEPAKPRKPRKVKKDE